MYTGKTKQFLLRHLVEKHFMLERHQNMKN